MPHAARDGGGALGDVGQFLARGTFVDRGVGDD